MVLLSSLFAASLLTSVQSASSRSTRSIADTAAITLYEASDGKEQLKLHEDDCNNSNPSKNITVGLNTCLWGDYYLNNNFKLTSLPRCGPGQYSKGYFYATTSCTGSPTYVVDEGHNHDLGLTDRCAFGTSTYSWSLIFTCDERKTQQVSSYHFQEAIPPLSSSNTIRRPKPKPSGGVVTPYYSMDCTINKPKEPTFLPTDTCLTLEKGMSIYISEAATCRNGKVAYAVTYNDQECEERNSWLGTDVTSDHYRQSVDKKCHSTFARSFAFICSDRDGLQKFADLPPHEIEKLEPLKLLDPLPTPTPTPTPSPSPSSTPSPTPEPKKPSGAAFLPHDGVGCGDTHPFPLIIRPVDVCVSATEWQSVQIQQPAVCQNGTQSLFTMFTTPNCKLGAKDSAGGGASMFLEIPDDWKFKCLDARRFDSVAFWCEGFELIGGEDGGKGNGRTPQQSPVKILLIVLAIVVLFAMLAVVSFLLKGARLMHQGSEFMEWAQGLFGKKDGAIQL